MFKLREKPRKIERVEKPTIGELTEKGFKINFSKLSESVQKCKIDKENRQCREDLKNLGVEIFD